MMTTLAVVTSTGEVGGAETIDINILEELASRGVDLRVALPRAGRLASRLEELGARPEIVEAPPQLDRMSRLYATSSDGVAAVMRSALRYETRLLQWLYSTRARAVLALGFRSQLATTPIARMLHLPVAWVASDFIPTASLPGRVWAWLARTNVRVVLTYSRAAAHQTALAGARVAALFPGVRLDLFAPGPEKRDRLIVMVGHLTPIKNHFGFIDVLEAVRAKVPSVRGVIAGRALYVTASHAEYARAVEAAVDSFTPKRSLELIAADAADIGALLRRAAVLVHLSSVPETFGLACAEAMASRCPVVAFRLGALPEVVGDCGLLIPPGDLEAAAAACIELLTDERRRLTLANCGRRRVERLFVAGEYGRRGAELISAEFGF